VQLLDEAIEAAVKLSHRYIPARQLPDKAVSLLDTACARVAVSQHATPPAVEDCQRRIEALTVEQEIIDREAAIGIDVVQRAGQVGAARRGRDRAGGAAGAGRKKRRWSIACSSCAPRCAPGRSRSIRRMLSNQELMGQIQRGWRPK
jgi:ATP-dependent Clp protease ATP-binding subunit ClpA